MRPLFFYVKKFLFFKLFGILNMKDKKEKHERVKKRTDVRFLFFKRFCILYMKDKEKEKLTGAMNNESE